MCVKCLLKTTLKNHLLKRLNTILCFCLIFLIFLFEILQMKALDDLKIILKVFWYLFEMLKVL